MDRLVVYVAGMVGGGVGRPMFAGVFRTLAEARRFSIVDVRSVGPDLRIDALPEEGV